MLETDGVWIVNATPFIGLAKLGRLDLLQNDAGSRVVLLPDAVVREVQAGPTDDPAVQSLARLGTWGVTPLAPITLSDRLTPFRLDRGESAVLTEALARSGSVAVIDDGAGRAAARALGLPLTGTLGVLIRARRSGRLPALAPVIRDLQAAGIFLPRDAELGDLLSGFGEAWP